MPADSESSDDYDVEAENLRLRSLYTRLNQENGRREDRLALLNLVHQADEAGGFHESLVLPSALPPGAEEQFVPLGSVRTGSDVYSSPRASGTTAPDPLPEPPESLQNSFPQPRNTSAPAASAGSSAAAAEPPKDPWDLNMSALDFDDDGNYNPAWCEQPVRVRPAPAETPAHEFLGPAGTLPNAVSNDDHARSTIPASNRHDRWYCSLVGEGFHTSTGYHSPPSPPPIPLPIIETSPRTQLIPPLKCGLTCRNDAVCFLIRYDLRYLHPAVLICSECLSDVRAGEANIIVKFLPLLLPPNNEDRMWSSVVLRDPHLAVP